MTREESVRARGAVGAARGMALGALAALLPLLAVGCGPGETTGGPGDPRGSDATFNFSWRINGQDPAAVPGACAAANVRFIRMTVVDEVNVEHRFDAFRFDCNLGRYRSAANELRAGTYRVYWEAIDRDDQRVSLASGNYVNGVLVPTPERLVVVAGQHLDLDASNRQDTTFEGQPTNFSTGAGPLRVRIAWAQSAQDTQGTECAPAGVAQLSWTLRLSNGVPIEDHPTREGCTTAYAALQWDRLNFDRYMLDVRGFDAQQREAWRGRCNDLLLASADGSELTCVVTRAPSP